MLMNCWRTGLSIAWLWLVIIVPVLAGDLSSDVRKGTSGPDNSNGGYFEVGVGLSTYTNPVVGMPEGNEKGEVHTEGFLDISARYQYRCLFAELFSQSLEQFTMGCNFYNGNNWSLDWVGMAPHDGMSEEESNDYRGLNKRRDDFMSGLRTTAYFGNYIVQMHALVDISDTHHGELYSLKLARHWQYRNWTVHGIVGATYRSQQITDYYFSIDESEASEKYPQFDARASMAYVAEVGASYPLNEKWVFRSLIRRINLDSRAMESPLILDDHGQMIATSVSYVF
ncbi:MAG: hypothetical protein B0W54_19165 [Cellvibrio sp. 79]|nr:MAG: hypothetical protein B0W54_19165 [Cellvibrio sp. 79]